MYRLGKQIFTAFLISFSGWLASMANVSNFITCISLNKEPSMTRPTNIDLNPDEYNQGLCYYSFMVKLNIGNGSYNALNDTFGRICVADKTEDIN